MKNSRCGSLLVVVCAAACFCFGASAKPKPRYEYRVTDLGTLPRGSFSSASRINNAGVIAGVADNGQGVVPFLRKGQKMQAVGLPADRNGVSITDINDSGLVLGRAGFNTITYITDAPFVYDGNQVKDLRDLTQDPYVFAHAINNRSEVVGYTWSPQDYRYHGFVFRNGKQTLLTAGPGTPDIVDAVDINDSGDIIAISWVQSAPGSAQYVGRTSVFRRGNIVPVGFLSPIASAFGTQINNRGTVVGRAQDSTYSDRTFIWRDGVIQDLGPWSASDLNNSDEIVGNSDSLPMLYSGGELFDVSTLVDSSSGWQVRTVNGINDSGAIVGTGIRAGRSHAILLRLTGTSRSQHGE